MVDMYSSHSKQPSFSSTLLDAIYRSIDQGTEETTVASGETRWKKDLLGYSSNSNTAEAADGRRWLKSAGVLEESCISSPWDSSFGCGGDGSCASLDVDVFYGRRLKPIRVWDSGLVKDEKLIDQHEKPVENSRALKMYAGLKKVKQPISPGAARLAGFLNSLFSSSNGRYSKKAMKISNSGLNSPILKSADSSTCSSASSFSRSCLSKTPSCRGKPNGGEKRSVRFSPVSVILNQNSQSCGNKSSAKATKNKNQKLETVKNSVISAPEIDEPMLLHAKEMNKRVEEAARDLLRNYQKRVNRKFPLDFRKCHINNQPFDHEESEQDDDAASYASSDLFELDNLSAIGMERYELPVYETTRLPENGLIL